MKRSMTRGVGGLAVMLLVLGGLVLLSPAQAQATEAVVPAPASISAPAPMIEAQTPAPIVEEDARNTQDVAYEPLTIETLVNLFWKARVLDPDKRNVLIEYIHLTSCDLFNEYYNDDFKWPQIIATTRDYIKAYRDHYPSQVSIIQPISFERYNTEKQWFALTSSTQYLNVSKMQIANFGRDKMQKCADNFMMSNIPSKAVLQLNVPFSITYVHMAPDEAKDYLAYIADARNRALKPQEERKTVVQDANKKGTGSAAKSAPTTVPPGDRYAYVRFNITILGVVPPKDDFSPPVFTGQIDSYTIAADREITKVLMRWTNKSIANEADALPDNTKVLTRTLQ